MLPANFKKRKQLAYKPGSVSLRTGESVIYLRLPSPTGSSGPPSDVGRATLVDAGLHDLTTPKMHFARDVADRIMFMDGGVVVEEGPAKQLIEHPQEERTKQFLAHYSE